jgi:hypothetical protein
LSTTNIGVFVSRIKKIQLNYKKKNTGGERYFTFEYYKYRRIWQQNKEDSIISSVKYILGYNLSK